MSVLRIQGRALPGGDVVDLYADGDQWTDDPVRDAELVGQGWLLPGLVDAHTHPGFDQPGPLDTALLRSDLAEHLAAGVTMLRAPGLAGDPPAWFGVDTVLPRAGTPDRGSPNTGSSSTVWDDELSRKTCRESPPPRLHDRAGRSSSVTGARMTRRFRNLGRKHRALARRISRRLADYL